jgi:murein DD-endopeptidase MepM/ murein hydrolase activator NlpD
LPSPQKLGLPDKRQAKVNDSVGIFNCTGAVKVLIMKKIKYYYNTHTLRYEKLETPLRVRLLRVFGFIAAALVTALLISYVAFRFIGSPGEKLLRIDNERMKDRYKQLSAEIKNIREQMRELEKRDNEVYRTIFEADPLPDSARAKELEMELEIAKVESMGTGELFTSIDAGLNNLNNRIKAQYESYKELLGLISNKEKILAHTPAIQPVSNKDLERIASGFGYRIDPIYKTVKLHAGLDFTAPVGTPVYTTANGTVESAGYGEGVGYGNHVVINHGYGYKTLYAHLVRNKVRPGQKVVRGEVIGWVGSTGKSTGPHLHYEVIRRGQKIDPVYFFYNDLTPEQFDRLLKKASVANQSFD